MTLVPILSLSGAPGVTTLACLLASTWAGPGPVAVVECDPSGGDLAARFGLSSTVGWPSLAAAVRRTGTSTPLDPHLQRLPGGLPVLVGAHEGPPMTAEAPEAGVVRSRSIGDDGAGLAVVDLGRMSYGPVAAAGWLEAGDWAVVVVRDDPAAAVRVREHAAELLGRTQGHLGLVVVGGSAFRCRELAECTGLVPLGDVPFDPESAAVASGASGAARRLDRSRLLATARRVGETLAARSGAAGTVRTEVDPEVVPAPDPVGHCSTIGSLLSSLRPVARRPLADGAT